MHFINFLLTYLLTIDLHLSDNNQQTSGGIGAVEKKDTCLNTDWASILPDTYTKYIWGRYDENSKHLFSKCGYFRFHKVV